MKGQNGNQNKALNLLSLFHIFTDLHEVENQIHRNITIFLNNSYQIKWFKVGENFYACEKNNQSKLIC